MKTLDNLVVCDPLLSQGLSWIVLVASIGLGSNKYLFHRTPCTDGKTKDQGSGYDQIKVNEWSSKVWNSGGFECFLTPVFQCMSHSIGACVQGDVGWDTGECFLFNNHLFYIKNI